ncbi:hypothetical protein DFH29DRAFT_57148 [Suillus ampliporus]|nr:hypothetical protein DFH29DRAFT_57148 [Suillus ampliporus]
MFDSKYRPHEYQYHPCHQCHGEAQAAFATSSTSLSLHQSHYANSQHPSCISIANDTNITASLHCHDGSCKTTYSLASCGVPMCTHSRRIVGLHVQCHQYDIRHICYEEAQIDMGYSCYRVVHRKPSSDYRFAQMNLMLIALVYVRERDFPLVVLPREAEDSQVSTHEICLYHGRVLSNVFLPCFVGLSRGVSNTSGQRNVRRIPDPFIICFVSVHRSST